MTQEDGSLTAEDWLLAGFRALARQGVSGLTPENLASDLGVTSAAFQDHFPDSTAFRAEILACWSARAYGDVMAEVARPPTPAARLRRLAVLSVNPGDAGHGGAAAEPALRAWAREDAAVAQAVAEMDARRVNDIKALCLAAGVTDPEMPLLIYAASAGYGGFDAGFASQEQAESGMRALLRLAGVAA